MNSIIFPIVQGSVYHRSAGNISCMRFVHIQAEGYAIGGLSVGEPEEHDV